MKKTQIGDLVCMGRRKTKGMGIVLDYCPNAARRTGINIDQYLRFDRSEKYLRYTQMIDRAPESDRDLIRAFMHTNNDTCYKKFKNKFAFVRWSKKPSFYESAQVSEDEGWYPIDWLTNVR
jgi:hypothetical protein